MSTVCNNGYLLRMDLVDAFWLAQETVKFARKAAQKALAAEIGRQVLANHDNSFIGLPCDNCTTLSSVWTTLREQFVLHRIGRGDLELDLETVVAITPYPANHEQVLARLFTNLHDVRCWWKSQKGVVSWGYDSRSGPDEDEDEIDWEARGRTWAETDERGWARVQALGTHGFPIPPREEIVASLANQEVRVADAASRYVDHTNAPRFVRGAEGLFEYFRWRMGPEGKVAHQEATEFVRSKLPATMDVDRLFPPAKT